MRSAAVSNDLDDLEIPMPAQKRTSTGTYLGFRNSLGLYISDEKAPNEKMVIHICTTTINGHGVQMPFFSLSNTSNTLRLSLRLKNDGYIYAAITISPLNRAMVNNTLEIPLGGIPFIPIGEASSDDEY